MVTYSSLQNFRRWWTWLVLVASLGPTLCGGPSDRSFVLTHSDAVLNSVTFLFAVLAMCLVPLTELPHFGR
jgi:hypothetical protein